MEIVFSQFLEVLNTVDEDMIRSLLASRHYIPTAGIFLKVTDQLKERLVNSLSITLTADEETKRNTDRKTADATSG